MNLILKSVFEFVPCLSQVRLSNISPNRFLKIKQSRILLFGSTLIIIYTKYVHFISN